MSMVSLPFDQRPPVARLLAFGTLLAILVAVAAFSVSASGVPIALAIYFAGLALATRELANTYPHAALGGANLVTTLRLALTAAAASALMTPDPANIWGAWAPTVFAAVALCLDAVDGWLARRQGLCSAFGARYDMEVDAALAAILAVVVLSRGTAGAELIVLGAARYIFILAGKVAPWLGGPLPESFRRKTICVIQIGALVALTIPILPDGFARPIAICAALLVAGSFALDIRWLAVRR